MSQKRNNYDYDNNDEQSSSSSKKNRRINKNGILGYTNEDNPFGDDELNRPFKWLKKDDDDEYTYSKDEITNKILNNEEKILEVRKRRQKFEKEKRDREEARENMKRLEELEKMEDLYAQQEAFEKKQAFANCRVRLTKNNAKPIDYLIKNILLIPEMNFPLSDFDNTQLSTTLSPELRSPHDLLYSLSEEEKSEIISDIELLKEYEPLKPYHEYFDTLAKYINMLIANKNESSFNEKTLSEIDEIYMDKEYDELLELSNSIKDELDHGENTDVDYWSTVYMRLSEYMYNQLLVKMNKEFISKRDPALVAQSLENEQLNSANQMNAPLKQYPIISIEEGVDDLYSPPPLTSSLSSSYPVMTLDEFKQDLEKQRKETKEQELDHLITSLLLSKKTVVKFESIGDYDEDTLYRYEESKGMDTDETQMKDEVSLPKTTYKWEDKYKPRKPKYFNRVKSGFDWNQYNQTHYDSENPPPKMIQGYRFNIFYPDLIRKDITPRYFLEPLEDQHYCIIRFHAGPPYEDIAFKIVNRQWDKVPRHGFKHFFERGILHLHFDFKRYRYRR